MRKLDQEIAEVMQGRESELMHALCRLVYLQPNPYSDEALAVGVIIETGSELHLDKINSPDNYKALQCLFGEQIQEQTIFALETLRESVYSDSFYLSDAKPPTDILKFGPLLRLSCESPEKYARDLLRLSSSLYRTYRTRIDDFQPINQKQIVESLKQSIVRLDPLKGRELIKPVKVQLKDKSFFEIPICGPMTIGTPISMMTKEVGGAKTQAEASIARLHYAREKLNNKLAVIYVYAPPAAEGTDRSRIDASLEELELVGKASDVEICAEDSIDNLARAVFRYEHAL